MRRTDTRRGPHPRAWIGLAVPALAAAAWVGCERTDHPFFVPNARPVVELTAAPEPMDSVFYRVRLEWTSFDPEGRVSHHIYAVDPPAAGDTSWVRTEESELVLLFRSTMPPESLPPDGPVISDAPHVFVLKAVDDTNQESAPVFRAFTSYTVAPQTRILAPEPRREFYAYAPIQFLLDWEGLDPDGTAGELPVEYRTRLVTRAELVAELGLSLGAEPGPGDVQRFFSADAPEFGGWERIPGEATSRLIEGLRDDTAYFLALAAIDEAGAYEPRFLLDGNVLRFKTVQDLTPPTITLLGVKLPREGSGGYSSNVLELEYPADTGLPVWWFAEATVPGGIVTGYRWALDIEDLSDERPRERDDQTDRWSAWSITETSARIGPFEGTPGSESRHRFYVQARDNFESVTTAVLEVIVVSPSFSRPLLIVDDFRGRPDRALFPGSDPRNNQPYGTFPTEAVLDTLLYARGGVPYRFRPPGTTSEPGMFAGFPFDTLDYRFFPYEGLPLRLLSEYQVVILYTGREDAVRDGEKFSTVPRAALREINTAGRSNTLATYLESGGKLWLFGDGVAPAIANGFVSRFGHTAARFPYVRTDEGPTEQSVLRPGSFLFDYMKIHSEMNASISSPFPGEGGVVDLIPNLPEFRTPGAPCPAGGWEGSRGECDDPRVSCAAERNRARWGDLPKLTLTTEFADWPAPLPEALPEVPFVSKPLEVIESGRSSLDTLYLARTTAFESSNDPGNPDGKPVFLYYGGDDHGPVAWTTAPLWMFEREQLRQVAEVVLREFGLVREFDPSRAPGPGSANRRFEAATASRASPAAN